MHKTIELHQSRRISISGRIRENMCIEIREPACKKALVLLSILLCHSFLGQRPTATLPLYKYSYILTPCQWVLYLKLKLGKLIAWKNNCIAKIFGSWALMSLKYSRTGSVDSRAWRKVERQVKVLLKNLAIFLLFPSKQFLPLLLKFCCCNIWMWILK